MQVHFRYFPTHVWSYEIFLIVRINLGTCLVIPLIDMCVYVAINRTKF